MANIIRGVDVHGDKGAVNWSEVKKSGISFAFVKATEGRTYDDPRYEVNIRNARAAGVRVGSYHFARPDHNSPESEVAHFLSRLDLKPGDMLPVLDFENPPASASWALRFMQTLERKIGAKPIFYSYPYFVRGMAAGAPFVVYPLWLASYGANDGRHHSASTEKPWRFISIHQYTSNGRVPGISGSVDISDAHVSLDRLIYKPRAEENGWQLPGPSPKPDWFWVWADWARSGRPAPRPRGIPRRIPLWAWRALLRFNRLFPVPK